MNIEPKEKEIQSAILEWLKLRCIYCWRTNAGKIFIKGAGGKVRMINVGTAGISDIIGILPDGKFLAIEVKTDKGKLTFDQTVFLDAIKAKGGIAFVARSVEDVENNLNIKEL